jgi:hypothetical protein
VPFSSLRLRLIAARVLSPLLTCGPVQRGAPYFVRTCASWAVTYAGLLTRAAGYGSCDIFEIRASLWDARRIEFEGSS